MILDPRTITRSDRKPHDFERLADYQSKQPAIDRRPLKAWAWPNRYAAEQGPGIDYDDELRDGFALKYRRTA